MMTDYDPEREPSAEQQITSDKGKERGVVPSDDEDDIYEDPFSTDDEYDREMEEDEDEEDGEEAETVIEDPFEPVYATPGVESGVTIEPVSLDNILPEGASRRRH